jgi:hypothetical protein
VTAVLSLRHGHLRNRAGGGPESLRGDGPGCGLQASANSSHGGSIRVKHFIPSQPRPRGVQARAGTELLAGGA